MNKAEAGADFPAVGDWVALRPADMMKGGAARGGASGVSGSAQITAVLPRRSAFLRKAPGDTARDRVEAQVLAANVDSAFIVMAAGRDWNPRRLERYLALAGEAGVQAVIVITKADLAEDPEALLREAASTASGVERTLVCAPEGQGLESLTERLLPGRTIVLLGSSGAASPPCSTRWPARNSPRPARCGPTTSGAGTRPRTASSTGFRAARSSSIRRDSARFSSGPKRNRSTRSSGRSKSTRRCAASGTAATSASPAAPSGKPWRGATSTSGATRAGGSSGGARLPGQPHGPGGAESGSRSLEGHQQRHARLHEGAAFDRGKIARLAACPNDRASRGSG